MGAGLLCFPAWIVCLTLCVGMCSIAAFGQGIYIPKGGITNVNVSLTDALTVGDVWPNTVYLSADPAGDISFPDGTEVPLTSANTNSISMRVKGEKASGTAGGTKISASDADALVSGDVAVTVFSADFGDDFPIIVRACGEPAYWNTNITVALRPLNISGRLIVRVEAADGGYEVLADGMYNGGDHSFMPSNAFGSVYAEWTVSGEKASDMRDADNYTYEENRVSIDPSEVAVPVGSGTVGFSITISGSYDPGEVQWHIQQVGLMTNGDASLTPLWMTRNAQVNVGNVPASYWITAVAASGEPLPCNPRAELNVLKVEITPDGTYLGSGKDTNTITIEADLDPDLTGVTWAWSKDSGTGSGTFTPDNAADTEFGGTMKGELVVKAEATVAGTACSTTQNVTVIQVDELTEDISYQFMDMFYESSGSFSVDYTDAGGDLRSVLVAAPADTSDPYEWDTDFYGQVDHLTGNVDMTFVRDGEYVLKIERESGGVTSVEYVQVLINAGDSPDESQKTKKTEKIVTPSADLVLISSSANDNKFLENSRSSISGEKAIGSVNNVVSEIEAKFTANGNQKFSLVIVDHGKEGHMSMGDGNTTTAGGYVNVSTTADLKKFTDACKDRVTSVTFVSCEVGKDTGGATFLQKVADDGKCTVKAYDKKVYCRQDGTWSVDSGASLVTKSPSP